MKTLIILATLSKIIHARPPFFNFFEDPVEYVASGDNNDVFDAENVENSPLNFGGSDSELVEDSGVLSPDFSSVGVKISDISNSDILSFGIPNSDISNFDVPNSEISNLDVPNSDISNVDISNSDFSNYDISNTGISNSAISNSEMPISENQISDILIQNSGVPAALNQPIESEIVKNNPIFETAVQAPALDHELEYVSISIEETRVISVPGESKHQEAGALFEGTGQTNYSSEVIEDHLKLAFVLLAGFVILAVGGIVFFVLRKRI